MPAPLFPFGRSFTGAAFALLFPALLAAQTPALKVGDAPPAKAKQTRSADMNGPATGELVLHKWSGELNVPDPVACTVDPQGRVYVSTTTRRKVGDLDIREHTMWIPDDVALSSAIAA